MKGLRHHDFRVYMCTVVFLTTSDDNQIRSTRPLVSQVSLVRSVGLDVCCGMYLKAKRTLRVFRVHLPCLNDKGIWYMAPNAWFI